MWRQLAVAIGMIAIGVVLNGCTKCGSIWDDWIQAPKSCRSGHI
jgi:hypothetical protein